MVFILLNLAPSNANAISMWNIVAVEDHSDVKILLAGWWEWERRPLSAWLLHLYLTLHRPRR